MIVILFHFELCPNAETSEEARARRQAYIVNQNQRGLADERKWWQCCFNANRTKKIYPLMVLPRTRVRMSCPNCQALIRTRLEYHVSLMCCTHYIRIYLIMCVILISNRFAEISQKCPQLCWHVLFLGRSL